MVTPPQRVQAVFELKAANTDHQLSSNQKGTSYLVSPEDVLAKRSFKVGGKRVRPKADLELLLYSFKWCPDPRRLVAAQIEIK